MQAIAGPQSSPPPTDPADQLRAAVRASYVAFAAAGFGFASWAARIAQVRAKLDLGPAALGLVLLAIAAGSLVSLPLAGAVVTRWGPRRTVTVSALVLAAGLTTVAIGYLAGLGLVVIGLFAVGLGNGSWDVAMNVQGAAVEQRLGRAILPRFHAGYSIGTVAGALVGVAMVAGGVSVTAHLLAVALILAVTVPMAVRWYLPASGAAANPARPGSGGESGGETGPSTADVGPQHLRRWREPRTVLIGMVVLAFALTEGTGNDWITVAMIDGYGSAPSVGTLALAAFLAAMTVGRWFGPMLLDRYGRVRVLLVCAALAAAGLVIFGFGAGTGLAFAGVLLWGAGASLGFPVGMSAAADEPEAAAARVSVVASIGYCAFLAGPPVIGLLGNAFTVQHGLIAVAAVVALASLALKQFRPPDHP